jgi:3-hydroxyisobutyrate dehydrogenase
LPLGKHVEAVTTALLSGLTPGAVIVDTSTSEVEVSRRLAENSAAKGIGFLDAPVSGGPAGGNGGTLTMMISGNPGHLATVRPVLDAIATRTLHVGPSGAGHVAKLVNNMLVAAHLLTVSEGLRLAEAAGVPAADVLAVVNAASGRSAVSEVNYPRWIHSETFDSGFTMGLMRKDVRLAADLATSADISLPMSELAAAIWARSAETFAGSEDFNRIVEQPGSDRSR